MPRCGSCRHWFANHYNHCPICAGTKKPNALLDAVGNTITFLQIVVPLTIVVIIAAAAWWVLSH